MVKEKEKKPERYEVTILAEDSYTIYPKIAEPHSIRSVTYSYGELPPSTLTIDLFGLFKAKQEKALTQIKGGEGDLYEKYLKVRSKKLRKDIEKRKKAKPVRVKV